MSDRAKDVCAGLAQRAADYRASAMAQDYKVVQQRLSALHARKAAHEADAQSLLSSWRRSLQNKTLDVKADMVYRNFVAHCNGLGRALDEQAGQVEAQAEQLRQQLQQEFATDAVLSTHLLRRAASARREAVNAQTERATDQWASNRAHEFCAGRSS
jgi:hypothetical protein